MGNPRDKLWAQEELTKVLLRCDGIMADGNLEVRTARKSIVKFVESELSFVDAFPLELHNENAVGVVVEEEKEDHDDEESCNSSSNCISSIDNDEAFSSSSSSSQSEYFVVSPYPDQQ